MENIGDNMKFNREHLEEETLQKIKEVNAEAGRSKLYQPEVPEMVNIVASIMEDKFRVEYDDFVNQIHLLSKELDKAQIKAEIIEGVEALTERKDLEEWAFYESGLVAHGCLENIDEYMHEAITRYGRLLLSTNK